MTKNKRGMGGAWIWILIVLILLAIGVGIYFWLFSGGVGNIPQPPALPN